MKHLTSVLFLSVFILFSCSEQGDDGWEPNVPGGPDVEKTTVSFELSAATVASFAELGITELGIYAYGEDSLLVYGQNLTIGDGNLKIDVPLGENISTFAVANAGNITDRDSVHTVTVYQNSTAQNEIFLSPLTVFISDRSVETVSLELTRAVGQGVLRPTEDADVLAAVTEFDQLQVIFNDVVVGYRPGSDQYVLGNVTVSTTSAAGYQASVYSFATQDTPCSVEVVYLKGGSQVNRTREPLWDYFTFVPSKRIYMNMPILDEEYLEHEFSASSVPAALKTRGKVTVEETNF